MAVIKDREYIIGSAVSKSAEPKIDNQWRIREKEHSQKMIKQQNKFKAKTLLFIIGMSILTSATLSRSSNIYEAQASYNTIVKETRILHKSNESLRADIIKVSAIENVIAEAELMDLVQLTESDQIEIDLEKNNFRYEEDRSEKKTILEKMFSALNSLTKS